MESAVDLWDATVSGNEKDYQKLINIELDFNKSNQNVSNLFAPDRFPSITQNVFTNVKDFELLKKLKFSGLITDSFLTRQLNVLREKHVDLIFMDIQMPQITGIEFLKTLKHPPRVIITTAYREYALEGFELDVFDYLLKPITFERFLKAVNKYYQMNQDDVQLVSNISPDKLPDESFIYIKENKKVVKIYLSEIKYIEGLSEYVQVFTEKRKIITKTSMAPKEEKLPADSFLRIHKSFIVSIGKIEAFTANTFEIQGKELPIGQGYKNGVLSALNFTGSVSGV
ncbi:MAG: response regulator transcription factor [Bacteroidota bacterium]|nr:response regulator transcription factor [Bacteroidota bacterium]